MSETNQPDRTPAVASAPAINASADSTRVDDLRFDIASGMLESLGLNMYTSIGKSLSEFVANAYDAEATKVSISIPFETIVAERTALRDRAKADVAASKRAKFTVLSDPLPDTVRIVIKDDGHGMSPTGIQDKFLIINRNRRQFSSTSETEKRNVMGRKGLGKLAGFGTAEQITIWSKRAGVTFATEFTMDYSKIKANEKVNESHFTPRYIEDLPIEDHGTTITLCGLRCDSLKASPETIAETMSQNFAIFGAGFKVEMNDVPVEEIPKQYEFIYPAADELVDGYGTMTVFVSDMFSFDIRYIVRFVARETDDKSTPPMDEKGRVMRRGSLPTSLRGARIYCHGRLAAGPSLLKLQTGMHNFHSQSYMECVVHADEIDKQVMDYIGTNRSDLKGDSDVVEALRDAVTEIMRIALREHSKFRDEKVSQLVETDDFTQGLLQRIDTFPKGIKSNTKMLLKSLASVQGVTSELYRSTAPLVMQSMNAGEVLSNLIRLEMDPKSIEIVAHELVELARVENSDVLKLYRGRRAGVEAVRSLCEQARATWKKGTRFENKLHQTLKENAWLLGPDFNRCVTSDKPLSDVARELSAELKVDDHADEQKRDSEGNIENEDDRPDLVFLTSDTPEPNVVTVVELKTPNYPLRMEHFGQLESYCFRVDKWLKAKYGGSRTIVVKGILIGDLDDKSTVTSVQMLNDKMHKQGPDSHILITPLRVLMERARKTHVDAIEVASTYEEFFDAELSTASASARAPKQLTATPSTPPADSPPVPGGPSPQ